MATWLANQLPCQSTGLRPTGSRNVLMSPYCLPNPFTQDGRAGLDAPPARHLREVSRHLAAFWAPSTACFQASSGLVPCSTAWSAELNTLSWMVPEAGPFGCAAGTFLACAANSAPVL